MQFFLILGFRHLIKSVQKRVMNFLSKASEFPLSKCYLKKKKWKGYVSENGILILFSLIRAKLNFRKVVGAAAFLRWENTAYLRQVWVNC